MFQMRFDKREKVNKAECSRKIIPDCKSYRGEGSCTMSNKIVGWDREEGIERWVCVGGLGRVLDQYASTQYEHNIGNQMRPFVYCATYNPNAGECVLHKGSVL